MRRLVSALSLLLVGLSVAAADDGAAPETFDRYAYRLLVTRPLVPAAELGGYEAFRLAITRRKGDSHVEMEALSAFQSKIFGSTGPHLAHFKEEQEHFGSGESQVTYADAIADWEELAQGGNPEAMGNLGVIYDLGLGVVPNPARAVELYRAASDRGWPEAQMNLGIAYALGRGVERSESQAVRWLRAASENGSALAPNTLGVLHLIAGDERSAIMELSRAVARRYAIASRNLERLFEKMADDPEFEDWYWNTAVPQATGWVPVPDDPVAAYDWFDRAADRGFPAAARKRGSCGSCQEGKRHTLGHVIRFGTGT